MDPQNIIILGGVLVSILSAIGVLYKIYNEVKTRADARDKREDDERQIFIQSLKTDRDHYRELYNNELSVNLELRSKLSDALDREEEVTALLRSSKRQIAELKESVDSLSLQVTALQEQIVKGGTASY